MSPPVSSFSWCLPLSRDYLNPSQGITGSHWEGIREWIPSSLAPVGLGKKSHIMGFRDNSGPQFEGMLGRWNLSVFCINIIFCFPESVVTLPRGVVLDATVWSPNNLAEFAASNRTKCATFWLKSEFNLKFCSDLYHQCIFFAFNLLCFLS